MSKSIERIRVDSSMLYAVGYDGKEKVLYAEFLSGKIFGYEDVPRKLFKALLEDESKGSFMREVIINQFPEFLVDRRSLSW